MTAPAALWTRPGNSVQASGFDFDLPSPLTVTKSPSAFYGETKHDWPRTTRSFSLLGPHPHDVHSTEKETAGPFELHATDARGAEATTDSRPKSSSGGSAPRVDSGQASTATSTDGQEVIHTPSPEQSLRGGTPMPASPDGSAQAYSAQTSLQRVLRPDSNHPSTSGIMSRDTFTDALENPPANHRLHEFSKAVLGPTHMAFLDQIHRHRKAVDNSYREVAQLDEHYLRSSADSSTLLAASTHTALRMNVDTMIGQAFPSIRNMFDEAEQTVQNTIFSEVYPKFVQLQMTLSASEALGGDRHKFQGLGDCFCLTQPSTADNPILYASDGFVAVTGYQREEIIPRNCRFLQGQDTDSAAIDRLRQCIRTKQESVEFILNYQKNGRPFWNLRYSAPLLDASGQVAFYIGGQVNCSSSIHGKPDIMKILAVSPDHQTHPSSKTTPKKTSSSPAAELARRVESVKALRYRQKAQIVAEPGIERGLIESNQDTPLTDRLERFYNAYSKYLVISYPSLTIHFNSAGISEILVPSSSSSHAHPTTTTADPSPPPPNLYTNRHVFNFLNDHMLTREKSDWAAKVRNALKRGLPISVVLNLQTRRSRVFRGDERFATHWTPLKDVEGVTKWVVLCLSVVSG